MLFMSEDFVIKCVVLIQYHCQQQIQHLHCYAMLCKCQCQSQMFNVAKIA